MKPSELFKLPHISETFELYSIKKFLDADTNNVDDDKNKKVQIRHYVHESFDGERGYEFMSVWYLDSVNELESVVNWVPFMICGKAGRGGCDADQQYITDIAIYNKANSYIRSITETDDWCKERIADTDVDIEDLGNFYNIEFKDVYKKDPTTVYKEGDIVIARVRENHLNYDDKTVLTRVKINTVHPHSVLSTYHGTQIDRNWNNGQFSMGGTPVFNHNKGTFGACLKEDEVIRLATDADNAMEGYPNA